jgi:biopolymer transport protein ExbB/TolQ
MSNLIDNLSGLSTIVIASACAVHLFAMLVLWLWSRRDMARIASTLDDFTRGIKHRSVLDKTSHLSDQIEAFLEDVKEVIETPSLESDRELLLQRVNIIDEKRRYLNSLFFETSYNTCRTMIEAYPLAGVLGTILAIGAALQSDEPSAAGAAVSAVSTIVANFGDAIWSTFAGLSSCIVLMFLNSCIEPPFGRLAENRTHVRDMIARVKRELNLKSKEVS